MLEHTNTDRRKRLHNDTDELLRKNSASSASRFAWGSAIVLTGLVAALTYGHIKNKIADAMPEPEPEKPALVAASSDISAVAANTPIDYNHVIRTNFNVAVDEATPLEEKIAAYEAITDVAKNHKRKVTDKKYRRLFDDAFFALGQHYAGTDDARAVENFLDAIAYGEDINGYSYRGDKRTDAMEAMLKIKKSRAVEDVIETYEDVSAIADESITPILQHYVLSIYNAEAHKVSARIMEAGISQHALKIPKSETLDTRFIEWLEIDEDTIRAHARDYAKLLDRPSDYEEDKEIMSNFIGALRYETKHAEPGMRQVILDEVNAYFSK